MAIMNEYLNQFKGKTINKTIMQDCRNYLLEEKLRITEKNPNEVSLVSVLDPKTKEIISIGGSTPSDLILDAFGLIWSQHNRTVVGGTVDFGGMIAEDNVSRTFRFINIGTPVNTRYNEGNLPNAGGQVKIGQGISAVARTDFDIETPFVTTPESLPVNVSPPIYDNILNQISFFTLQVAGGSGTISEIGFFLLWRDFSTGVTRRYMIAHDLILPTVSFIATQSIAVNWIWQI